MNGRLLLVAALMACGGPPSQAWRPTEATAPNPKWSAALDAWTRQGEAYEAFEGRLFTTATLYAPSLTNAWLRTRADREGWSAQRLEQALLDDAEAHKTTLRVLVGIAAQDVRWDDAAPKGTLEFGLTADGLPMASHRVKKLRDDDMGDLAPYFTWITPLHSAYLVEFPPVPDARKLALRVAGPPARIVLHWEVAPP